MIELDKITKIFGINTVNENILLSDFSFKAEKGDFVSIVGSNGSGKTTLLNLIGGSLTPEKGKIYLDGEDITGKPEYLRSRRISRVYQNPALGTVPDMTIFENLMLAENKNKPALLTFAKDKKKTDFYRELLSGLGLSLEDKLDIKTGLLSGGQRQALALVMSTMTETDLLLLDEHTAALDPKTAEIIMRLTDKVVKEKNITVLMVTHNLRFAVEYGNRTVMMHKGQIVIDKGGKDKENLKVSDLLGTFNEISVECGN